MTNTIGKQLKPCSEKDYGSDYKSHYLEIYKLYVEKADAISTRRQSANSFFLTINTAILGVTGYIGTSGNSIKLALGLAGILLCFFWYKLILSYKQLNSGKFKVIHEIEKKLPLAPYDAEWEAVGRGKKPELYKPFTLVEMAVPRIFFAFHFILMIIVYWHPALKYLQTIIEQ